MTLLRKGLILVAVPLIFELAFVAALSYLLHQAEVERDKASYARDLDNRINFIPRHFMEAANCMACNLMFKSNTFVDRYQKIVSDLPPEFVKLREMLKDQPQKLHLLGEMEADINEGTKWMNRIMFTMPHERVVAIQPQDLMQIRAILGRMSQESIELAREPHFILEQESAQQEQYRTWINEAIVSGIILNILIAVWLAVYFARSTAGRLNIVIDNTLRLATGQPLNPQISGQDEIAHLDKTFRHMAEDLRIASDNQRSINERIRLIVDSAPVGLLIVTADGTVEQVNPAGVKMFAASTNHLEGKSIDLLFPPDEDSSTQLTQYIAQRKSLTKDAESSGQTGGIASSGIQKSFQRNGVRRNGEQFTSELLVSEFTSDAGPRLLITAVDVSDRHRLEKLKEKFFAMVSHDLKTPLTSLHGTLVLLLSGAVGNISSEASKFLRQAEEEIARLTSMVIDLLDVARIDAGRMQLHYTSVQLDTVIRRAVASVQSLADKNSVDIESQLSELEVEVDGDRIVQVLINLLTNAIKFSPADSKVFIAAEQIGDSFEVRISDQGRGIPESHKVSIFERFQQVEIADRSTKGGTGLGLPICKSIIEQHHGTIGVHSEIDKGSTFWFRLPVSENPILNQTSDAPADQPVVSSKGNEL
jgi:PAS domain S-box-containing protein